jgi:hypothetical protein
MKQNALLVLTLAITIAGVTSAMAHRPYFTQVEKIRLPNGEMGEARLLNGDGILGPDPVRVIILDPQGRLLARSHQSISMNLSCQEEGRCLIFDFTNDQILDLDASTFQQGEQVPGLADEHRNDLWDLESGQDAWGFTPRELTQSERPASLWALVIQYLSVIIINGLIGALCSLLGLKILVRIKIRNVAFLELLAAAFALLVLAPIGAFLVLVSGYLSVIAGLPMMIWLASITTGGGIFLAGYSLVRATRSWMAPRERLIR